MMFRDSGSDLASLRSPGEGLEAVQVEGAVRGEHHQSVCRAHLRSDFMHAKCHATA
jgi:hypothetical protein